MPTTILDGETYEQARHRRFTEEAKVIEKMQQDEIIRMAREAGFKTENWTNCAHISVCANGVEIGIGDKLERFAALVAAHERKKLIAETPYLGEQLQAYILAEREACAVLCEDTGMNGAWNGEECAAAIRARTT